MSLPKDRKLVLIDRLIDGYKKRHDNSEFLIQIQLCEEILLDLQDIRNLITVETNGENKKWVMVVKNMDIVGFNQLWVVGFVNIVVGVGITNDQHNQR